ncbi:MAG: hypothetical protein KDB18_08675 [Salinibacterium sp.]|nr:hypothetical protein [Salinibacterium sp.]
MRPLDLGTLLGAAFRVLRRNPRPTFGVALLVQVVVTVVSLIVIGGPTIASLLRLQTAAPEDECAIVAGTVAFGLFSAALAGLLGFVANAWLQGIIVIEVARATLGEKLTLSGLWGHAKGRVGALVGWSLIVGLALGAAVAILVLAVVALVSTLGPLGIGLGVFLGIFGGFGLLVVAVWISTKLSLVPSAIMIERVRIRAAMARSWSLTRGFFWRVFGIQLLVGAILGIAMNVISAPFSIAGAILGALVDPTGAGTQTAVTVVVIVYIVQLVITLVLSAIAAVISTAASSLIYLDLRMRKEGLDLRLTAYVEAQQTGTDLANPYLPDSTAGTPSAPPAA